MFDFIVCKAKSLLKLGLNFHPNIYSIARNETSAKLRSNLWCWCNIRHLGRIRRVYQSGLWILRKTLIDKMQTLTVNHGCIIIWCQAPVCKSLDYCLDSNISTLCNSIKSLQIILQSFVAGFLSAIIKYHPVAVLVGLGIKCKIHTPMTAVAAANKLPNINLHF